jgi:hypothetical protein
MGLHNWDGILVYRHADLRLHHAPRHKTEKNENNGDEYFSLFYSPVFLKVIFGDM